MERDPASVVQKASGREQRHVRRVPVDAIGRAREAIAHEHVAGAVEGQVTSRRAGHLREELRCPRQRVDGVQLSVVGHHEQIARAKRSGTGLRGDHQGGHAGEEQEREAVEREHPGLLALHHAPTRGAPSRLRRAGSTFSGDSRHLQISRARAAQRRRRPRSLFTAPTRPTPRIRKLTRSATNGLQSAGCGLGCKMRPSNTSWALPGGASAAIVNRFIAVLLVAAFSSGCVPRAERLVATSDLIFGTVPGTETVLRVKRQCSVDFANLGERELPVGDYIPIYADSNGIFYAVPTPKNVKCGNCPPGWTPSPWQGWGIYFPIDARSSSPPLIWRQSEASNGGASSGEKLGALQSSAGNRTARRWPSSEMAEKSLSR